jgi:glutamine synthetase
MWAVFRFLAFDEAARVRTELMDSLRSMGLEVEVGHHEVALGQHEIDFRFTDAVRAADNVLTLKYTVKADRRATRTDRLFHAQACIRH